MKKENIGVGLDLHNAKGEEKKRKPKEEGGDVYICTHIYIVGFFSDLLLSKNKLWREMG